MDAFLGALAQGAAGALTGKAQAVKDNADIQEQQQQASNKLMLDRMKIQADQDAETRKNAFSYAQELQKSLTPDNLKFMQDNGLLDQHRREIDTAMGVVAGRIRTNHWQPQFAFEAPADASTGSAGGGGPVPTTTGAGGAPSPAVPAPVRPAAPSLAAAGGMIPGLTGPLPGAAATSPFGPAPPQVPLAAPPPTPAAPVARQPFTLTEAQNITRRTTAETEAQGKATRDLEKKKFNLQIANDQIDKALSVSAERVKAGQAAFDSSSKIWEAGLKAAIDMVKSGGGSGDDTAKVLLKLLSVPNGLGRSPNANAIIQGFKRSGVDENTIFQVLNDPSMRSAGVPPISLDQVTRIARGESVNLSPEAGGTLQTPQSMIGVGTGGEASRGGAAPLLPPVGPQASPEQIDAALRSRSRGLANRAGGAPGTVGAARAAVAAPGALTAPAAGGAAPAGPRLAGNQRAIQEIARMAPEAKMAARAGFKALADAGIPFTVNSTFRTAGQQAALVRQKQAGKNPNPVAPVGKSTHQAGLALDLSNTGGTQEQMAAILAPFGWKWAGPGDPPHFTFVGTPRHGATAQASRGGGGPAPTATAPPPAGGGSAPPPAPAPDLTSAAQSVGVRTPAMAPAPRNPYPMQPGAQSVNGRLFNLLTTGQKTPEDLIRAFEGNPDMQQRVQTVAEQVKNQQGGGMFAGIPTPSMAGARLPTQAGIDSLGSLMYTEPGIGTPNITTEPFETAPNTARTEATRQDLAPQTGGGAKTTTDTGKGKGKEAPSGGGGNVDQPRGGPSGGGGNVDQPDRGMGSKATPKAPSRSAPSPLEVPPPPSLLGVNRSRANAQGPLTNILDRPGTTNVLGVEPRAPTPEKVSAPSRGATDIAMPPNPFAGQGPKAGPLTPEEIRSERQAIQPYLKSPYRAATERWLKQNKIDDMRDRRYYLAFVTEKFVPELQRRGVPEREIQAHLDHYLRAHQAWKPGVMSPEQRAPAPTKVSAPTRGATDIAMPPNPFAAR